MKSKTLPEAAALGPMRHRPGVRFSFAGTAFLNHYAALLESLSLTPSRVLALAYIDEHPGCPQSSLGRVMGINRASAMLLIDKLESHTFVERRPGPDRRTNALFLSPEGQVAFEAALQVEIELYDVVFGWMGEEKETSFFAIIDEITARSNTRSKRTR
jgi:DNA-binding MarR family transcriptional regulator